MRFSSKKLNALALWGLLLPGVAPLVAWAESVPDFAAETLTGDWGGARTQAWQNGVHWEGGLKWDLLNGRSGASDKTRSAVHLDLKLRTDLENLFGWKDTVAYFNVIDDGGNGTNAHAGSLTGVSNIEVPVATARVFNAWVQKGFFDDQFSVLAGIYPIDSEFFTMDSAALLIHPAYGTPADLALTHSPSIFNNAAFGVRAKAYSSDRSFYGMAALMDGVPNDPDHPKRTAIQFSKANGAFAIAEFGWTPLEAGHFFEATDPARVLPTSDIVAHEKYGGVGKYALGFWGYSAQQPDLVDVNAGGRAVQRHSTGGYVLAERTLWGLGNDVGRDVSAFVRYTFADPNTIAIDQSWNLGLRVRGPVASRPQDTLVIGWTQAKIASKYRRQFADPASVEEEMELSWRIALSPWLAVQPDAQYLRNPGGNAAAKAVTVVGARLEVVF